MTMIKTLLGLLGLAGLTVMGIVMTLAGLTVVNAVVLAIANSFLMLIGIHFFGAKMIVVVAAAATVLELRFRSVMRAVVQSTLNELKEKL